MRAPARFLDVMGRWEFWIAALVSTPLFIVLIVWTMVVVASALR